MGSSGVPRRKGVSVLSEQTRVDAAEHDAAEHTAAAADVGPDDTEALLEVVDRLRTVVGGLEPRLSAVCSYHFGWTDAAGRRAPGPPGKMLRARMTLTAAGAFGAPRSCAVHAAAAVELVHNFSLLHDDVMDGDDVRRGRPAAWRVFGVNLAVLAGDALLCAGMEETTHFGEPSRGRAHAQLSRGVASMIHGQSVDLASGADHGARRTHRYLAASRKTGGLFAASLALGAVAGGASPSVEARAASCGEHLGLVYQMINDVEDIWGDPADPGVPSRSDLRNRRLTYPVLAALRGEGPASARVRGLLTLRESSATTVEQWIDLLDRTDASGRVMRAAHRHTGAVHRQVAATFPPGPHRRRLQDLVLRVGGPRAAASPPRGPGHRAPSPWPLRRHGSSLGTGSRGPHEDGRPSTSVPPPTSCSKERT